MQIPTTGTYQLVLVASNEIDDSVETELFIDNLTGFDLPDVAGSPGPAEVTIEATTPTVSEAGPGAAVFTLTRAGGNLDAPLTVTYYVYGSATPGDDYEDLSGEVTFAAGSATATINVTPIDDSHGENDEDVVVYLDYPWNGTYNVGYSDWAEATILDDDGGIATVGVTALVPGVDEAAGPTAAFAVTRTGGTIDAPLTVTYYVYGSATEGEDYQPLSGTVTILAGQTTATIDLAPVNDAVGENDESVYIYLAWPWNGDYQIDYSNYGDSTLILDDDGGIATVGVTALVPGVGEAAGATSAFAITRTGGNLDSPLTVTYYVYGSAAEGTDYEFLSGTVTFAAGQTSVTIDLDPIDDSLNENDESVYIYLAWPWGGEYQINYDNYSASTLILDND